jgi:hypothetical protein
MMARLWVRYICHLKQYSLVLLLADADVGLLLLPLLLLLLTNATKLIECNARNSRAICCLLLLVV